MTTASELIVKLSPEGVDETVDGLEDAQDSFEETANTADDESQQLEQFASRFKGALAVAAGGLAIASASLLNTVPVVGETISALGAIIQSLGLRIDQTLRPALSRLNAFLFTTANRLAETRGPMGQIFNVILTVVTAVTALIGALGGAIAVINTVTGASLTLGGVLGTIGGALGAVATAIVGVIAGISALTAAIVAAVALAVAFAAAWITNFMGVRDTTNAIVNSIVAVWTQGIQTLLTLARAGFNGIIATAQFAFDTLVAGAKRTGNGIVRAFVGWVNSARDVVVDGMNAILAKIEETVNAGLSALSALPEFDFEGISIGRVQAGQDIAAPTPFQPRSQQQIRQQFRGRLAQSGRQGREGIQQLAQAIGDELDGALPNEIRAILEADGRSLAEATDKFRGSSVANRGR